MMAIFKQDKNDFLPRRHMTTQRDMHIVSNNYTHSSVGQVFGEFMARVVYFASIIVSSLLALRFVLTLLGANPANMIASFIYNVSSPLVAPFAGLFSYQPRFGTSRFDFESLLALVAYGIIAWIIVAVISPESSEAD